MRELNPVGREDDNLLLVTSDGERFSLAIDDTLMRTIKEHRVPDSGAVELSPREIQDAIRSGVSVTELSERSGGSVVMIEKFAHPVIEELRHVVELAQSVRIELPADRFNDIAKKPFGELVESRLHASGAKHVAWSARREQSTIWEVVVSFQLAGNSGSATWSFDPKRYILTPESATAQNLSSGVPIIDTPLGKQTPEIELNQSESETVITEDTLDAFRKRREQISAVPTVELGEESQEVPEVPEPSGPSHKKSRAPMPSWDEIVRGTQTDNDVF